MSPEVTKHYMLEHKEVSSNNNGYRKQQNSDLLMGITSDGFALLVPLSSFSSMDLDFSSPSILMANSAFSESAQLTLAENLTQYLKELGLGPPVQQRTFP